LKKSFYSGSVVFLHISLLQLGERIMMSFFGLMKNSRSTKIKAQMLKRKKLKTKSPNKKK
jgi:hypothetical protein